MSFMRLRELSAPVGQIGDASFLATSFEDVVEAAKLKGRQIRAIGIARPILHRAGHTNHLFYARIEGIDFGVGQRPIHVISVEGGGLEIDITEASGTAPPEICFAADCAAPGPKPSGSRSYRERDLVIPRGLGVLVVHVTERFRATFGIV